MTKLLPLLTFFFLLHLTASAQRCGTDEFVASLHKDKEYQNYLNQLEAIKKIAPEQRSLVCAETVIIPVAVHYNDPITCDDPVCLLEAAEAQIAVMNEDFLAVNADYSYYEGLNAACPTSYPLSTAPVVGEGACIQFCLATQNHPASSALMDGDPAITVGQYEWANDAPDWPGYMNIFVDGSQGGLGIAWLPGDGNGDGFWVTPSAFGGPGFTCTSGGTLNNNGTYNLGRTATHEAGHYLGLPHVFGSCNDSDSNPPGPIDINDTPPQANSFFGCPTINSCADVPTDCSNDPQSIFSFMDYTDDPCMVMFTADQSAVLNWHANNIPFTDNATLCGESYGPISCVVPPGPCDNGTQDADEQDVDCGWDFLEVYDGSSTAAPQIGGEFCGTTLAEAPGGGSVTASAPGGCLTFLFDSDGSVTPDGWEADITCVENGTPDLSPITTVLPTTADGITASVWTIKVQENEGVVTNGTISVIMPKDLRLSFSYDQQLTTVGIFPVENALWTYAPNSSFHIWTRDTPINPNESTTFGFEAVYDPQNTSGTVSYNATILNASGGETNGSNNIDVETIIFNSN